MKVYSQELVEKGADLRKRRLNLGFRLQDVADIAGISLAKVWRAEHGKALPHTVALVEYVIIESEKRMKEVENRVREETD